MPSSLATPTASISSGATAAGESIGTGLSLPAGIDSRVVQPVLDDAGYDAGRGRVRAGGALNIVQGNDQPPQREIG
jgi:hypothetical protein